MMAKIAINSNLYYHHPTTADLSQYLYAYPTQGVASINGSNPMPDSIPILSVDLATPPNKATTP